MTTVFCLAIIKAWKPETVATVDTITLEAGLTTPNHQWADLLRTDGSLLLFQGIQRDQKTDDAANAAEIGQSDYVSPPLGTDFPRELHTRLQSAHAGWTGNRLYPSPSTNWMKLNSKRRVSTGIV